MKTIPPTCAAEEPTAYINQFYLQLPRLFSAGSTQDEVDTLLGGFGVALERGLHVQHGKDVDLCMFANVYGWAPIYEPTREDAFDLTSVKVNPEDPRPAFRFGDWLGLIFVPSDGPCGWQRWDPAAGPAPVPKNGRMLLTVVLLREGSTKATVCQIREVYGKDKGMHRPLYKPAMDLAPATPAESAHLIGTLRALLASDEAA